MKRLLCALLACALCLCLLPAALAQWNGSVFYALGDTISDFTLTTPAGEQWTLSEQLATHKAVLLNFWFAGCGPCRMEFPYLAQAYLAHQEDVAVLAITPYDNDERISAYQAELDLPFAMARDTIGITNSFVDYGFPTSVLIDRNGVMCFSEAGSQPDAAVFLRLFAPFLAEDYDAPVLLSEIPAAAPPAAPAAEAVDEALNAAGGALHFDTAAAAWPWLIGEDGALYAANAGQNDTAATLTLRVNAQAGDVLAFRYRVSSEPAFDTLQVRVNGQLKKQFSGERAWQSYALPFEAAGDYEIAFVYAKDERDGSGADTAWLDDVALLRGEAALAALAENPRYPLTLNGADARVTFIGEDARRIEFDDPDGSVAQNVGADDFYIVTAQTVEALVELGAEVDADAAVIYTNYDSAIRLASDCPMDEKGFYITTGGDSLQTTGYGWSAVVVYPLGGDFATSKVVVYFASEADADAFCQNGVSDPVTGAPISGITWHYADAAADGMAEYTLSFVDQNGQPVAGVIANICDEDTCTPMFSDSEGRVTFTAAAYPYDIHVIQVPVGYAFDLSQAFKAPAAGGEMRFEVRKEEGNTN